VLTPKSQPTVGAWLQAWQKARDEVELRIETKTWSLITKDKNKGGGKTIGGTFAVKCGPAEVATKAFNDESYGAVEIAIPPELLVKVNEIDAEVRRIIEDNFTK